MLETKCKTCLGCNRLEDRNFKEVYDCKNYIRGTLTTTGNIIKIKQILGIQEKIRYDS